MMMMNGNEMTMEYKLQIILENNSNIFLINISLLKNTFNLYFLDGKSVRGHQIQIDFV